MTEVVHDPYRNCEHSCTHDLARGVLVYDELLDHEGPFEVPLLTQVDIQESNRRFWRLATTRPGGPLS